MDYMKVLIVYPTACEHTDPKGLVLITYSFVKESLTNHPKVGYTVCNLGITLTDRPIYRRGNSTYALWDGGDTLGYKGGDGE